MKRRRFIDDVRELECGFVLGMTEFIHASREIHEALGLEPIAVKEIRAVLQVMTIAGLLIVYFTGIYFLAR